MIITKSKIGKTYYNIYEPIKNNRHCSYKEINWALNIHRLATYSKADISGYEIYMMISKGTNVRTYQVRILRIGMVYGTEI